MNRNPFLDYAKGILIVLVTVGHSIQFAVYQDADFWADPLYKAIYLFHMPLFMGFSGYLAYSGIQRSDFFLFSFGKCKAYILPILAWAILFRLVTYLFTNKVTFEDLPVSILIEAAVTLWFLWALLGCLILTAFVKATGWNFWFLYAASFFLVLLLPERGNIVMFKFMYPYFQAGYTLAAAGSIEWKKYQRSALLILSVVGTALGFYLWTKDTYIYNSRMSLTFGNSGNIALRYAVGFAASTLMVFVLHFAYQKSSGIIKRSMEILGRDSIFIYILQSYLFIALSRVVAKIYAPISNIWLGSVMAVLLGLVIAWACWFTGNLLAKNEFMALLLFGKSKKPKSTS